MTEKTSFQTKIVKRLEREKRDREARVEFAKALNEAVVVPIGKLIRWLDRQLRRWPWLYERLSDD